jgi:hypothetical protein
LQEAAEEAAAHRQAAAPTAATVVTSGSSSGSSLSSFEELTFIPEEFELPPGVLSEVDRTSPASPDDVFRCPGCTKAECMVRGLWAYAVAKPGVA